MRFFGHPSRAWIFAFLILLPWSASTHDLSIFKIATYDSYQVHLNGKPDARGTTTLDIRNVTPGSNGIIGRKAIDGHEALITGESGFTEWTFTVKKPGFYNLGVLYYPVEGKTAAIERELRIDGEIPFREARTVVFQRIWKDHWPVPRRDNRGNDLRPRQVEAPRWRFVRVSDLDGYYPDPYRFYLSAGHHTLRFTALREPMAIGELAFLPVELIPSYRQMMSQVSPHGFQPVRDEFLKVQGEDCTAKSDPTLYPVADRSSPATEPYDVSKIRLNTVGGYNWRVPGQWISWRLDVPQTGLYEIALKVRQNFVRGVFTNRELLIDGRVPFREVKNLRFVYDRLWKNYVIGGGRPYLFPLAKGTHSLTLVVTLGDMAPLVKRVEQNVLQLNTIYRRVLMVTGAAPDPFRDYRLDVQVPGLMQSLNGQAALLQKVLDDLVAVTGEKGSEAAIIAKLVMQLEDFVRRPDTIPQRMAAFKANIGALGAWLLVVRDQPLQIDYLVLASPSAKLPAARAGFLSRFLHELGSFFASFTVDYNTIGNAVDPAKALDVWILGARDRAQILKPLIDEGFPDRGKTGVNLKLVDEKVLLPATLSGRVGDVVLNVKRSTPVNFALRGAVSDLASLPGFASTAAQFSESALVPYTFEKSVYALPEQEYFDVMFYRKDILSELGIAVPQTWEDLYRTIPILQKHNLEFGLPFSRPLSIDYNVLPPNETFAMLLFQHGGAFYRDGGRKSGLDSEESIRAFNIWTQFYTAYKLNLEYDFANRFRTGEMPIAVQRYDQYNMLSVFAPELRGLWDFGPVPGTRQPDGTIRRDVISDSTACMLMKSSKRQQSGWEFIKWWVSTPTQTQFGRELESLLGAGGRYPTANIEALQALPWPVPVLDNLEAQWKWVRGIPEVPGGYFTGRHLDNAFRRVVYNGDNPRETLLDYVDVINEEIASKRKEFGLDQ